MEISWRVCMAGQRLRLIFAVNIVNNTQGPLYTLVYLDAILHNSSV